MKKLIAILLACILLAAMIFVTGCDEGSAGENVVPQTYIVTFFADGKTVGKISFTEGDTSVTEPEVPHKDCCVGVWES